MIYSMTESVRAAREAASIQLWLAAVSTRLRSLGLSDLDMRHCQRLDALYAELNASRLDWSGGIVGRLPDGRCVWAGEKFWWAEK